MLERVPLDQKDWKPHEKSMTVGRLATHVAETPHWITDIAKADEFNFATAKFANHTAASTEELLQIFQTNLDNAINSLSNMADEDFQKHWVVKAGEKVMFDTPKKVALRGWAYSHLIHHRGQLSVYLRLLNVAVPGMYGPSADER
jgi:uncharacterized damage-inducible protein DinB